MKVYNNILNNLNKGLKMSYLDECTIDKLINDQDIVLYRCTECGEVYNQDHSAKNECISCYSNMTESLGTFNKYNFVDYELCESNWKRLSGPRKYKPMEDRYENNIKLYLFPLLEKYGIKMTERPIQNTPGKQTYLGYDKDDKPIWFIFTNQHLDKADYREGKRDLLCTLKYNNQTKEAGVMLLNNKENADAFELIMMTLESMTDKPKEETKPVENDDEIEALARFNMS